MSGSFLVVALSGGDRLKIGPGPRQVLEARAQELWESGARTAQFLLDDELLAFGEEIKEGAPKHPPPGDTRAPSSPPPTAVGPPPQTEAPLTLERAVELARQFVESTSQQCERLLRRSQEGSIEAARAADQLLERAQQRALEHDAERAKAQAEHTKAILEQSYAVQRFISELNATAATERATLFKIKESEQQIAERQAAIDVARQQAALAATRPSAAQIATDFIAAFAVRYAQNAHANFVAINDAPIVTEVANEPERN